MKIHIISDLHEEMWRKRGASAVSAIPEGLGDVLVMAGDLAQMNMIKDPVEMFKELRDKAERVLYVKGNHEPYEAEYGEISEQVNEAASKAGVCLLDESGIEIKGQKFFGTTLWYDPEAEMPKKLLPTWSDSCIENLKEYIAVEHRNAVKFLRNITNPQNVIITHFLPSWQSVPPKYAGAELNHVFVVDMERVISEEKPPLWIHGHTHTPFDYKFKQTRIVCSPLGYPHQVPHETIVERLSKVVEL